MILALTIFIGYFVIVGIYSYIYSVVNKYGTGKAGYGFGFLVGFFGINIIMLVFEIILLVNPALGFSLAHYAWIICMAIAMFIASIAVGIYLFCEYDSSSYSYSYSSRYSTKSHDKLIQGVVNVLLGVVILALMIFGTATVKKSNEIIVSNSFELRCLANMPKNKSGKYIINIDNDIDFNGKKATEFGSFNSNYVIKGNGHSIKNICFEMELTREQATFIRTGNASRFEDLKMVDCQFYLIPNYYDEKAHTGLQSNYSLFGNNQADTSTVGGITFENIVIYIMPAKENVSSISFATIGEINTYGNDQITVIREEEKNDA